MPNNKTQKAAQPAPRGAKKATATVSTAGAQSLVDHRGNVDYLKEQTLHLSQPAEEYLHLLANPCGAEPKGMPWGFPAKSLKVKTFIRTTMATGSNNKGFCILSPGTGAASNLVPLTYTDTLFAGTAITQTPAAGAVVNAMSNSPYQSGVIGGGAANTQFRLVSACLRVRYRGTTMDRGGSIVAVTHPDHLSLNTYTEAQLLAFDGAIRYPVTEKEWIEVVYNGPVNPNETEYVFDPARDSATGPAYNACMMAIWISSATAAAQFDVEAWMNFEFIGAIARGKTENLIDPVGAAVVSTAMTETQQKAGGDNTHHGHSSFLNNLIKTVGSTGLKALTYAVPAVGLGKALVGKGGGLDKAVHMATTKILPLMAKRALTALPLLM